jgi:hypothetical protein
MNIEMYDLIKFNSMVFGFPLKMALQGIKCAWSYNVETQISAVLLTDQIKNLVQRTCHETVIVILLTAGPGDNQQNIDSGLTTSFRDFLVPHGSR